MSASLCRTACHAGEERCRGNGGRAVLLDHAVGDGEDYAEHDGTVGVGRGAVLPESTDRFGQRGPPTGIQCQMKLGRVQPHEYLWRAVDHEGEILESYITKTRDKDAALTFMKKALKRHGRPETITTDGLRSYGAAMKELGNADKQEVRRWANNRVENSHLSFRRRERTMLRFGRMKTLQKFASVHANVHNYFNLERHLVDRLTYKARRSAALVEWQILAS